METILDYERMLDVLIAASTTSSPYARDGARQLNFIEGLLAAFSPAFGTLDDLIDRSSSNTIGQLTQRVRSRLGRPPGPNWPSLLSLAGLLLHRRKRPGIMRGLIGLGGHIIVSAVAHTATKRHFAREIPTQEVKESSFLPSRATPEDSLLFVRAMIAAVVNARCVEENDYFLIVDAFRQCGVTSEEVAWLSKEFMTPASSEKLAADALTIEKTTLVYAAVRVAIDKTDSYAIEFTDQLSDALSLALPLRAALDDLPTEIKSPVP